MHLLHTIPTNFFLDNKIIDNNPIGISCKKLGLKSVNILITKDTINQFKHSFKNSKIVEPNNFVYSGLSHQFHPYQKMRKKMVQHQLILEQDQ